MTTLEKFIPFQTTKGNRYAYDRDKNSTLLCNPILHHFIKMHQQGLDIQQWINDSAFPIQIDGIGLISHDDCRYYLNKFNFLKQHGYFTPPASEAYPENPITPELIEFSLANNCQVTFETTESCSLACKYCGYGQLYQSFQSRHNAVLDLERAQTLLNFMAGYWNSSLNISSGRTIFIGFYGGEPLLNMPFIQQVVRFAKKLKLKQNRFHFSMTTNALLLEKNMHFLVENDFNLLLSLDGNEQNNAYRVYSNGKPAFKEILRNIEALREHYPRYFERNVNFNAVLHDKNSVAEIHRYISETFGKIPRIGEIKSIGVKTTRERDFWKMYTAVNQSLHSEGTDAATIKDEMFIKLPAIQNLSTFLLKYSGFVYEDYRQLAVDEVPRKQVPTGSCLPFAKKIFVTADGLLLPCETIIRQFYFGRVFPGKVELDVRAVAEAYNAYYAKINAQCNGCYNKEACLSCVFNIPAIDGENPVCAEYMDSRRFSRYLAQNLDAVEQEPIYYSRIMEDVTID